MHNLTRRHPAPLFPWALVARGRWGDPKIIRVPETAIAYFTERGWVLVAKDSDVPLTLQHGQWFDPTLFAAVKASLPPPPDEDAPTTDVDGA